MDFLRGSDLLTFTFVSDGHGSGKGFDIELLQVPDSCTAQPAPRPSSPPTGPGEYWSFSNNKAWNSERQTYKGFEEVVLIKM